MSTPYVQVAVEAPLADPLTYIWPKDLDVAKTGQSVIVPLGKRKLSGVIVESLSKLEETEFKLKEVASLHEERPVLPEAYIRWMKWLSRYYLFPIGQIFSSAFPPLKKKGRGSRKAPLVPEGTKPSGIELNQEQLSAVSAIDSHHKFDVHLLHGVTGSGKTEVYIELFERCLKRNQSGLLLVPEISLTPQLIQRFSGRLGSQIAVLHSHLTDREKTDQWWSVLNGEKKILIGARSALFCPMPDLGLIILDEEHEGSFKQDEKLKYHARDAAIMLAKYIDCPIVLGSATPSLESYFNSQQGKYKYHRMESRVAERPMPEVRLVDLRDEKDKRKEDAKLAELPFWLSSTLHERIHANLENKKQVALFLNRRGVAQTALCQSCGFVYECPNCAISLTLHGKDHLICHYCDYSERMTEKCKSCSEESVESIGMGTELLETDLRKLFPHAQIARADRDEIQSREHLEEMIRQMETGEIDILVGTQMIAKGLDFPQLNLVGLVLADIGFNLPDFRAAERSFQLLTQVAGRAGRHSQDPGEVIIQTFNPSHPSIVHSQKHDFIQFAEQELQAREEISYPPFARLALVRLQASSFEKIEELSRLCQRRLQSLRSSKEKFEELIVLGPAPAPMLKLRNKYRHHALLKAPNAESLHLYCRIFLGDKKWIPSGSNIHIDVDPVNML